MKIALAQINPAMGNIAANADLIREYLQKARKAKLDLCVFPELCLTGYPIKDDVFQTGFVKRCAKVIHQLAQEFCDIPFIVGAVEQDTEGRMFNVAILLEDGKIKWKQRKRLLPNHDIFSESRYFDSDQSTGVFEVQNLRFGITICEDIWAELPVDGRYSYQQNPVDDINALGLDVLINISASPYETDKASKRLYLFKKVSEKINCPLLFCNLVGANDEVIFDGGSLALNKQGQVIAQAKVFEEDLLSVDLSSKSKDLSKWPDSFEEWTHQALVLGVRDFFKKCGINHAWVGLSGGVDSALTACLAVDALGAEHVHCVFMPSEFTSQDSKDDAEALAKNLGVKFTEVSIDSLRSSFNEVLREHFTNTKEGTTEENLQARIRGNILMAMANKFGGMVLNTGNKSELATGYCTQYGDMVGGLSVLADLLKTEVYSLAKYYNREKEIIPERVITRAPSAELKANQVDEDALPPYDKLDAALKMYVEQRRDKESMLLSGLDEALVDRVIHLVKSSEFKRKQMPPGLRISNKAFGVGRIMPIARGPSEA